MEFKQWLESSGQIDQTFIEQWNYHHKTLGIPLICQTYWPDLKDALHAGLINEKHYEELIKVIEGGGGGYSYKQLDQHSGKSGRISTQNIGLKYNQSNIANGYTNLTRNGWMTIIGKDCFGRPGGLVILAPKQFTDKVKPILDSKLSDIQKKEQDYMQKHVDWYYGKNMEFEQRNKTHREKQKELERQYNQDHQRGLFSRLIHGQPEPFKHTPFGEKAPAKPMRPAGLD